MSFMQSRMLAAFVAATLATAAAGCETATLPRAESGAESWNLSGTMDGGTVGEGTVGDGTTGEEADEAGSMEEGWAEAGWVEVGSWTTADTAAPGDPETAESLTLTYETGETRTIRADTADPKISGNLRGGSVTFPDGRVVSWVYSSFSLESKRGSDGVLYWHLIVTERDGTVHHYIWSVGRFRHFTKPAQKTALSGVTTG